MRAHSELDCLARAIGAVGKAGFYEHMARYLRKCLSYDNVIVVIFQGSAKPSIHYKEIFGPNVFRYLESRYLPAAYLLDPVYHFHLKRGKSGVYRLLDIAPDQFRRSRYYNWYYGRIGITDEISVVMTIGGETTITISMGKDKSSGQMFSAKAENSLLRHEAVIMALLKAHWLTGASPPPAKPDSLSLAESLIDALRSGYNVMLSRRQAEVALLILQGHSSPSIGLHLGISPQTVKVFRKQLYGKCGLSSQAELFALMMPILEGITSRTSTMRK